MIDGETEVEAIAVDEVGTTGGATGAGAEAGVEVETDNLK